MRQRMDLLAEMILASLRSELDDFDEREELWMEREDLRALLRAGAMTLENKLIGAFASLLVVVPL